MRHAALVLVAANLCTDEAVLLQLHSRVEEPVSAWGDPRPHAASGAVGSGVEQTPAGGEFRVVVDEPHAVPHEEPQASIGEPQAEPEALGVDGELHALPTALDAQSQPHSVPELPDAGDPHVPEAPDAAEPHAVPGAPDAHSGDPHAVPEAPDEAEPHAVVPEAPDAQAEPHAVPEAPDAHGDPHAAPDAHSDPHAEHDTTDESSDANVEHPTRPPKEGYEGSHPANFTSDKYVYLENVAQFCIGPGFILITILFLSILGLWWSVYRNNPRVFGY